MTIDRPISIAVILLTVFLLVFFLVMPEYNTFGQLQTQLAEKTGEVNAKTAYYAEVAKTYYTLQSRQDDIKKIDDALPQGTTGTTLGKLIYYLQYTAKQNGLIVKDLFLSKSPNSDQSGTNNSIKEIVFSTDLMGDYSSLENFMVSLEKSSRIFEVTNISFGSGAGLGLQSFSMQIKTFSY